MKITSIVLLVVVSVTALLLLLASPVIADSSNPLDDAFEAFGSDGSPIPLSEASSIMDSVQSMLDEVKSLFARATSGMF